MSSPRRRKATQRPDSAPPFHGGPHLFRQILRAHQALVGALSRELKISLARMRLMRQLAFESFGELGVADLARALGVTPAFVTRQAQELEDEGLVERRGDPRDGRRSYVRLTAKGHSAAAFVHERAHQVEESVLGELAEDEVEVACRVLARVRFVLEERHAARGPGFEEP